MIKMMKNSFLLSVCFVVGVTVFVPRAAFAHRSGCHTLHTCSSDTNKYVCGDLGYPCDGSASIKDISLSVINVPLVVEKVFMEKFERRPSDVESVFWKNRFRTDKGSLYKLRRVMTWHKSVGSFGPVVVGSMSMVRNINAMFRLSYDGRDPTVEENKYWITRIVDKPTEQTMRDAMLFHKENNILH
jgi:hypothetical protein